MKKIILALCIPLLYSCWPTSIGFKDGSVPPHWKYFEVETIENEASNAPISFAPQLTEELKDAIQNRTGVKLATRENIETQFSLSGLIKSYIVTPVVIQGNDNAAKNRLTVSANFELFIAEHADSEEEIITFTSIRFADFDADQDLGEVQNALFTELNEQVIQDVLNKLTANW